MPASLDSLVTRIKEIAAANNRVVSHITEMRTMMWLQAASERAHPTLPASHPQARLPRTILDLPLRGDAAAVNLFQVRDNRGLGNCIRYECRHLIDAMRLNIEMIRLAKSLEESPTSHATDDLRKLIWNFEEVNRVLREMEREVQRHVSPTEGLIARFAH